jgi:hypothetical protein
LYKGCEPCSLCDARSPEHGESGENGRCSASESFGDLTRRPITRLYYMCPKAPPEVPALEDLDPGDVLQGPDGATYRRTETGVQVDDENRERGGSPAEGRNPRRGGFPETLVASSSV